MSPEQIISVLKSAGFVVNKMRGIPGFVHRRCTAEIMGIKGWLVWDYILYNEIWFEDVDKTVEVVFFDSFSDKATYEQWDKLVEKYGI